MCLKLYRLITSLFKVANSRQPEKPGKFKLAGSCATDQVKLFALAYYFTQNRQCNYELIKVIYTLIQYPLRPEFVSMLFQIIWKSDLLVVHISIERVDSLSLGYVPVGCWAVTS